MDDVEEIGLLKMDFLGLQDADGDRRRRRTSIAGDTGIASSTSTTLPLDDPAIYELFCKARTAGVFQFESAGMQDILRTPEARPLRGPRSRSTRSTARARSAAG